MTSTTHHTPVILLLGKRVSGKNEVDTWLEESRFSTREATSVFQALEQISDFTMHDIPDVVFLHVDLVEDELKMLEAMLDTSAGDINPCLIKFSDAKSSRPAQHEVLGLNALASQLERLIPASPRVN